MDDFFLRPEQRTPERLAEPGGNIDYERFYQEVLQPLTTGRVVRYQRYNCANQTLESPVDIMPKALTIVEGVYSMHPMFAKCYDFSVFLRISPSLQQERVLKRNGSEVAKKFLSQWIPLETAYFEATKPESCCDLILEVTQ